MNEVTFSMHKDAATGLINLLGQLPTNSGVFPLLTMMVAQFNEQQEKKDEPANNSEG
jgi:hypothetical protein